MLGLRQGRLPTCTLILTTLAVLFTIRMVFPELTHITSVPRSPKNELSPLSKQKESLTRTTVFKEDAAKVYSFDGKILQRLHGFCRWLPPSQCLMLNGFQGPMPFYVHSLTGGTIGAWIHGGGDKWEVHNLNVILAHLKKHPDAGYVDIGSNIGPFVLQIAKSGRQVLSVEPIMDNVQKICKSTLKNNLTDKITMVYNPLSDRNSKIQVLDKFDKGGVLKGLGSFHSLTVNHNVKQVPTACGDMDQIMTVTLDDLLPITKFKTAIMKVDVESFEYYAINGGSKFFKEIEIPAIIMEWAHVKKTDKGEALVKLLKSLNYEPHHLSVQDVPFGSVNYKQWTHDILWLKKNIKN